MTEGTIVLMSQRTRFNIEEMGGRETIFSALEYNTLGMTFEGLKLTEPRASSGFKCRLEFEYSTPATVTELDVKRLVHASLRRVSDELLYQTEVLKVTTEKKRRFFPKRTQTTPPCIWCGRTNCSHVT